MRSFISKILIFLLSIFPALLKAENGEKYEKKAAKYSSFWQKMIPRYTKLQFAGSMGMLSLGTGWNYGKNHWETDLLLGIVPRNSNDRAMASFTLKQNYIPWQIPIKNQFYFEPLSCGIYINTLLDREFWIKNPDKYPKRYYTFSTRIRTHVFLGERLTIKFKNPKSWYHSISVFYEISTCDLYLISAIPNSYLKPKDYLSLSFGLKWQIL